MDKLKIRLKLIFLTLLIIGVSIMGIGCKGRNRVVTVDDYDLARENITLNCGITVVELEDKLIKFVSNVYNPQKEEDIQDGIEIIKELLTDDQYRELVSMAGDYKPEVKSSITNLLVGYSRDQNNSDGMARGYVGFDLETDKYKQEIVLEFVFNHGGQIFKHYIWKGIIKIKE